MRKGISMLLLVLAAIAGKAQSFDEWFRQRSTQLKYLREQVAALQAYIQVTKEGYRIVERGTQAIAALKKGDFDLHSGYFASLLAVKLAISSSPVSGAIADVQKQIVAVAGEVGGLVSVGPRWELVIAFFQGLLKDCSDDVDWMGKLSTNGRVQITDGERLTEMEAVYTRMQQRLVDAVRARNAIVVIKSSGGL